MPPIPRPGRILARPADSTIRRTSVCPNPTIRMDTSAGADAAEPDSDPDPVDRVGGSRASVVTEARWIETSSATATVGKINAAMALNTIFDSALKRRSSLVGRYLCSIPRRPVYSLASSALMKYRASLSFETFSMSLTVVAWR